MIAKVTRGSGFQGLLSYLLTGSDGRRQDRVAWLAQRNLFTGDTALIPSVMHATAAQSAEVQKPVYHLSISLDPGERLDRRALEAVVDTTLRDLGLDQHQAILVAHRDAAHQHVHVMINRVHPETGRAWNGGHDYARIEKSLRRQERDLGLRQVPGRHFALPGKSRHRGAGLSGGDRRQRQRNGRDTFGGHVRAVARQPLLETPSWPQLHRQLAELGLRLQKRGRGLVVTDGRRRVKASFVDRCASLAGLQRRLGPYQPPAPDLAPQAGLWRRIQVLRNLVADLGRRREAEDHQRRNRWSGQQEQRTTSRLEQRLETASEAFDARLAEVYRDPQQARRALEKAARRPEVSSPHHLLLSRPERFGRLLGRGGLFASAERWAAIDAVPPAAEAARDWLSAWNTLRRHQGRPGLTGPDLRGSRKPRRPARPPLTQLKKAAASLVTRLGWRLVARVLPAPQFQLLRLTLQTGRAVLDVSRDLGRGLR